MYGGIEEVISWNYYPTFAVAYVCVLRVTYKLQGIIFSLFCIFNEINPSSETVVVAKKCAYP